MKWKLWKTCEWLIKGRWMKTLDERWWIGLDEQLMDSIRMEFIILFEGTSYSLDFAFRLLTLNVFNKSIFLKDVWFLVSSFWLC